MEEGDEVEADEHMENPETREAVGVNDLAVALQMVRESMSGPAEDGEGVNVDGEEEKETADH